MAFKKDKFAVPNLENNGMDTLTNSYDTLEQLIYEQGIAIWIYCGSYLIHTAC